MSRGDFINILVTGSMGLLGSDTVRLLSSIHNVFDFTKIELDITNETSINTMISIIKPDVIINCAGYTNVDNCEKDITLAKEINSYGAYNLAKASKKYNSSIVYISTDYIFDGKKNAPYIESDKPNPLNIYGESKLLGEKLVRQITPYHYIIRTSWLYGKNGNNFVKTILNASQRNTKNELKVVNDQIGSPTYSIDLIDAINFIIQNKFYGTYHISNEGHCSWFEFAKTILTLSNKKNKVLPINSQELKRPAIRPKYSVLDNNKLIKQFNYTIRSWDKALKDFLENEM
jgi:dTDP-4-dehydrorhamnose reductase